MINWKLRLKNKTTLVTLITTTVALVYSVLSVFDIAPTVEPEKILELAGMVVSILAILGIVVDPTTDGAADSKQAMEYTEPKKEEK